MQFPPLTLGGAGVYANSLCRGLARLGHEVHVVSPSVRNGATEVSGSLFVHRVPVLNQSFLRTFSFWLRIRKLYEALQRSVDFDLLHTNVTSGFGLTPRLVKVPRVVTIHHLAKTVFQVARNSLSGSFDLAGETGLVSRLEKLLMDFDRVEISRAEKVVAVSDFVRKSVVSTYNIPESRVETIYSGVLAEKYSCNEVEVQQARHAFKFGDEPTILFVGRLEGRKNLEFLIRAFKLIVRESRCKLVIVGNGSQASLKEVVSSLGISRDVVFTGFVDDDDLRLLYNACDIFVLPSHLEGFGLTLLEAMAAAKPVIASNVGGIPELVKNGVNGILVDLKNPKELATALKYLLENPELARKMGMRNREYVSNNFTWEITAKKTSVLYEKILDGRARGGSMSECNE
jgi:glycosyltransferase involved in cell wall biosynthesis